MLAGGLIDAVGGSDVSDDEATLQLAASSAAGGGARGVGLRTFVAIGETGVAPDSAGGVDRSVAPTAAVDNGAVTTGASCWRSLVSCTRCATLKKP